MTEKTVQIEVPAELKQKLKALYAKVYEGKVDIDNAVDEANSLASNINELMDFAIRHYNKAVEEYEVAVLEVETYLDERGVCDSLSFYAPDAAEEFRLDVESDYSAPDLDEDSFLKPKDLDVKFDVEVEDYRYSVIEALLHLTVKEGPQKDLPDWLTSLAVEETVRANAESWERQNIRFEIQQGVLKAFVSKTTEYVIGVDAVPA